MESGNPTVKQVLYYFSFVMVLVYMAIGLLFIFTNVLIDLVHKNRTIIGLFFIAYGIFRGYMLIRLKRSREKFEESQK
jgi:hypothetical protein